MSVGFVAELRKDLLKWVKDHADDWTDLEKDLAGMILELVDHKKEPFSDYKGFKVCFVCDLTLYELIEGYVFSDDPTFTDFLENEIKRVIRDSFKE